MTDLLQASCSGWPLKQPGQALKQEYCSVCLPVQGSELLVPEPVTSCLAGLQPQLWDWEQVLDLASHLMPLQFWGITHQYQPADYSLSFETHLISGVGVMGVLPKGIPFQAENTADYQGLLALSLHSQGVIVDLGGGRQEESHWGG